MQFISEFLIYSSLVLVLARAQAPPNCIAECKRENNCACASSQSPLSLEETPQFVTLAFDDAVNGMLYRNYIEELFHNRVNPDNTPITTTFYVPHPYTDYQVVNDLYNQGHEIGLNSVSKGPTDYWKNANEAQLKEEFESNRRIINKFANIPVDKVIGARTPNLQISGDTSFAAYEKSGIKFDNSWVLRSNNQWFPFTLDYPPNVECLIGTCPTQSHPGIWVLPIINLLGKNNIECNALAACQIQGTEVEIAIWMVRQFVRVFNKNRAPITLMLSSSWFQTVENSYAALKLFLAYLERNKSVYIVSHGEVLNWSKNPVPLGSYKTGYSTKSMSCTPRNTCPLKFGLYEHRYLSVCGTCPKVYPWLGNPEGTL